MNRRDFLKSLGAAVAGATVAQGLPLQAIAEIIPAEKIFPVFDKSLHTIPWIEMADCDEDRIYFMDMNNPELQRLLGEWKKKADADIDRYIEEAFNKRTPQPESLPAQDQ